MQKPHTEDEIDMELLQKIRDEHKEKERIKRDKKEKRAAEKRKQEKELEKEAIETEE